MRISRVHTPTNRTLARDRVVAQIGTAAARLGATEATDPSTQTLSHHFIATHVRPKVDAADRGAQTLEASALELSGPSVPQQYLRSAFTTPPIPRNLHAWPPCAGRRPAQSDQWILLLAPPPNIVASHVDRGPAARASHVCPPDASSTNFQVTSRPWPVKPTSIATQVGRESALAPTWHAAVRSLSRSANQAAAILSAISRSARARAARHP